VAGIDGLVAEPISNGRRPVADRVVPHEFVGEGVEDGAKGDEVVADPAKARAEPAGSVAHPSADRGNPANSSDSCQGSTEPCRGRAEAAVARARGFSRMVLDTLPATAGEGTLYFEAAWNSRLPFR
jgi:threonine dehydrogenase-like Zn-dependent dehydrogenase